MKKKSLFLLLGGSAVAILLAGVAAFFLVVRISNYLGSDPSAGLKPPPIAVSPFSVKQSSKPQLSKTNASEKKKLGELIIGKWIAVGNGGTLLNVTGPMYFSFRSNHTLTQTMITDYETFRAQNPKLHKSMADLAHAMGKTVPTGVLQTEFLGTWSMPQPNEVEVLLSPDESGKEANAKHVVFKFTAVKANVLNGKMHIKAGTLIEDISSEYLDHGQANSPITLKRVASSIGPDLTQAHEIRGVRFTRIAVEGDVLTLEFTTQSGEQLVYIPDKEGMEYFLSVFKRQPADIWVTEAIKNPDGTTRVPILLEARAAGMTYTSWWAAQTAQMTMAQIEKTYDPIAYGTVEERNQSESEEPERGGASSQASASPAQASGEPASPPERTQPHSDGEGFVAVFSATIAGRPMPLMAAIGQQGGIKIQTPSGARLYDQVTIARTIGQSDSMRIPLPQHFSIHAYNGASSAPFQLHLSIYDKSGEKRYSDVAGPGDWINVKN